MYCAPLRLLAMEVYETLNHRGVHCDLVGGGRVLRLRARVMRQTAQGSWQALRQCM